MPGALQYRYAKAAEIVYCLFNDIIGKALKLSHRIGHWPYRRSCEWRGLSVREHGLQNANTVSRKCR